MLFNLNKLQTKKGPDKDVLLNQSKVFCMAPWVHQYIFPEGMVFPCCISAHNLNDNLGDLSKGQTLKQVWNSEQTKLLRANMLSGKKSDMCKLCYQYEQVAQKSSRQEFNEMFVHRVEEVNNTKPDGEVEGFNVRFIDFRFSNVCNLTCRTCSAYFSSKWFKESVQMGITEGAKAAEGKSMIYPVSSIEELWQQVEPLLDGLERIHFAGGEPLMMEEHYRILEYFIAHGKTDVQITYNTNFSEFQYKRYDVVELWKQLKHVSICASLDAMGTRGELMRKGISWAKIEDNRRRLLQEAPHVRFQLTPTVSIMNVLHLPDFYMDWVDRGLMQPNEINIYLLFEPFFYSIINLPPAFKAAVEKKYAAFFETYVRKMPDAALSNFVEQQFTTVLNHMNSATSFMPPHANYRQFTLASYNQKLDALRNEDFEAVFPELKGIFETTVAV